MDEQTTRILVCTCGKKVETMGRNVGEVMKETSFHPLFSYTGSMIWFCPECFRKIHEVALVIYAIVKDEYVSFQGMLKE